MPAISFVGAGTVTPSYGNIVQFNAPPPAQNGDLLILFLAIHSYNNPPTTPAGWSLYGSVNTGSAQQSMWVFTRTASNEPSTYQFNIGQTVWNMAVMHAYRNVASIRRVGTLEETSSVAFDSAATSTSIDNEVAATATAHWNVGSVPTSLPGWTVPTNWYSATGTYGMGTAYRTYPTAGSVPRQSWSGGNVGNGQFQSATLVLTPSNATPTAPTLTPLESVSKNSPIPFDWVFNDPDAGDTQSAYALVRKRVP